MIKFQKKKLRKSIKSKIGSRLDDFRIKSDVVALQELYNDGGFWRSSVKYEEIDIKGDKSSKILKFFITENDSRKIGSITFNNNDHLSDSDLLEVMETALGAFGDFGPNARNLGIKFCWKTSIK